MWVGKVQIYHLNHCAHSSETARGVLFHPVQPVFFKRHANIGSQFHESTIYYKLLDEQGVILILIDCIFS